MTPIIIFNRATHLGSIWPMAATPSNVVPLERPFRWTAKSSLTRAWSDIPKPWRILRTVVRFWFWPIPWLETTGFPMKTSAISTICPSFSRAITFTFRLWWSVPIRGSIRTGRHRRVSPSGSVTITFQEFTVWIHELSPRSYESMDLFVVAW